MSTQISRQNGFVVPVMGLQSGGKTFKPTFMGKKQAKQQNKNQERLEREERLQQQLRDNLRRRKSQIKGRVTSDDADAPLPRTGKIGVAKLDATKK
ncbi:MAG: hypothetical protein OCD03_07450 [Hyphomicrobiales bacterium]